MIRNVLRAILLISITLLSIGIIFVNFKVGYAPELKTTNNDTINYDVFMELRGLKKALNDNADVEMQSMYPEGYIFINALYGLAWCNFISGQHNKPSAYFIEGHSEIQKAFNKINSDVGRSSFNEGLSLPYGAFYTGWSTYLLGKKLSVEKPANRNPNEILQFVQQCERIESSIKEKTYPSSYEDGAWPADAMVCMASLSLHDKLFTGKYAGSIKTWMDSVKKKLDRNGLIPHSVNPLNDSPAESARGSSQSLMLIFLKDINSDFANEQFEIFKSKFLDTKLGLKGIREYPKGEYGAGDIDSGPVVFQFGSAATIVGMQALYLYGEEGPAITIRNTIEALGVPIQNDNEKKYLFGQLPIADVFITWGHSSIKLSQTEPDFKFFHVYSLIVLFVLASLVWIFFKL